jgi:signal transduction histidine kinase
MVNLIGNAIKFTEKGGITISATPVKEDDGPAVRHRHRLLSEQG